MTKFFNRDDGFSIAGIIGIVALIFSLINLGFISYYTAGALYVLK